MSSITPFPMLPLEICNAAKSGNLVLFIGAGISRMVGNPSWDGFADAVIEQLVKNGVINHHEKSLINALLDPKKRLSIAKILSDENTCAIDYKSIFNANVHESEIYQLLNQFECSFITTNYDKLINPLKSKTKPESNWRFFKKRDLLNANLDKNGSVIHLHGCVDDPNSMVVTTEDYLDHYSSDEIPKLLIHLFSSKVVLFLGYGLDETEILEYILKSSKSTNPTQKRLFILQGFFNAEKPLYDKLKTYYSNSFNAQLIPFPRDYKDFAQQEDIVKQWVDKLDFQSLALVDELAALEAELNG